MLPLCLLGLCAAIMVGCGGAPPGDPGNNNNGGANPLPTTDTTIAEVTYRDGASVVAADTMQTKLVAKGDDTTPYVFDGSASDVAALQQGDVVLFAGTAVRKVKSVTNSGGQIQVETEAATLNQAIQDGRLAWVRNIDIGALPAPEVDSDADASWGVIPVASSAAGARATTKYQITGRIAPWDIEAEVEPTPSKLNLSLQATLTYGGKKVAAFTGTGFVTAVRQTGEIQIKDGELANLIMSSDNYTGEVEVKWAAFNEGALPITDFARLSIPVSFPIPIEVGPVLLVARLKLAARLVPTIPAAQSSSGGSFKVTFGADQGFKLAGTQVSILGALRSANIGVSGETVSAGWIATGMAVGLEFPRFELSLFGTDTMAFVTVDTYAFSLYNPSNSEGKACQCGGVRFKAIAGYKLAILGKTALNSQHELWKKDFDKCLDNPCT